MTSIPDALAAALRHHQAGKFAEAQTIYQDILRLEPEHPDALHFLGLAFHQRGDSARGLEFVAQAIARCPAVAQYHNTQGAILRRTGDARGAEASLRRSLELDPRSPEALNNLANALRDQGRLDEAVACCLQCIELQPAFLPARTNLGLFYLEQGHTATAEACFRQVLGVAPDEPTTLAHLAAALHQQGRLREAIGCYRRALQLDPESVPAHIHLGRVYKESGLIDESVESYRQAIHLDPQNADGHFQLGASLKERGDYDEAVAAFERSIELDPGNVLARYTAALMMPVVYSSSAEVGRNRARILDSLRAMIDAGIAIDPAEVSLPTNFYLAYQGLGDREVQERIAELCHASAVDLTGGRSPRLREDGRYRIGFISSYFRDHTIARFWRGTIERLARDRFQVTVVTLPGADDDLAAAIRDAADEHVVVPRNPKIARPRIAELDLDILYYTDIGLNPVMYALAVSRLAPIQCVTWGHPDTTGLSTIDYFVSSKLLEIEGAQEHYTERLVTLDSLGIYYYPPEFPPPRKQRSDFDLPADKHLYGCLQSTFKFHPDFDPLLAGILRGDPEGLLVVSEGMVPNWGRLLRRRFERTMPDVADRIHFVPWLDHDDYMRLVKLIDVLLLPPQFGGGRTSYEALSLGVPIITLPTDYLCGRITHALYRQIGVRDCIAATPEEFVQIALRFGTDPKYRRNVCMRILSAKARLFEDDKSIADLEQFLIAACRAHPALTAAPSSASPTPTASP